MRTMRMLVILSLVALLAGGAVAKDMAKTSYRLGAASNGGSRDLAEGFEGAFPPAGWTIASPSGHDGEESWFQSDESVYEGTYAAQVNYDADLLDQDCRLSFDYAIVEDEDHLNFWVSASAYWLTNYSLKVLVDGTEVFDLATSYGDENWVWELKDIDLTGYIGQTVTITLQYVGNDGAAVYLDNVGVNAGADVPPPPEPPVNDTCDGAITIPVGPFSFTGDLTEANGDYDTAGSEGCTGYSAAGNDATYFVHLEPGDVLDVVYNNVADASLYLITDCDDSANTCLIGADDTVSGGDEVFTYTNETGSAVDCYLIVDCYGSGNGGAYTLTGSLESTVAVEPISWSTLKDTFR